MKLEFEIGGKHIIFLIVLAGVAAGMGCAGAWVNPVTGVGHEPQDIGPGTFYGGSYVFPSGSKLGIGTESTLGQLDVESSTAFTISSTAAGQDNIFIRDTGGTQGKNAIGASIGFSLVGASSGGFGRRAAIAAIQTGADADSVGLAFYTHPTATGANDLAEALRINANGNVEISGDLQIGGETGCTTLSTDASGNVQCGGPASPWTISGTNGEYIYYEFPVRIGASGEPQATLDITGSLNVEASDTNAIIGSSQYAGVYGFSSSDKGVHGKSEDGVGVYGFSSSDKGVHGKSENGFGVYGVGSIGVKGVATADLVGGKGVYGEGYYGFYGESKIAGGTGVYGFNNERGGYGVVGGSASADGVGVYGVNTATTGSGTGVFGKSASADGVGVYGENTADGGLAGKFEGDVEINSGDLMIEDGFLGLDIIYAIFQCPDKTTACQRNYGDDRIGWDDDVSGYPGRFDMYCPFTTNGKWIALSGGAVCAYQDVYDGGSSEDYRSIAISHPLIAPMHDNRNGWEVACMGNNNIISIDTLEFAYIVCAKIKDTV